MKVLVASMGRSGSMLLYNIIRSKGFETKHCHYFDKNKLNWADIIISTKRDIREQLASTQRYLKKLGEDYYTRKRDGSHNNIIEECDMSVKIYKDWLPHTSIVMNLEDWFTNPKKYVKTVFETLNIETSDKELDDMVTKFNGKEVKSKHITKSDKLISYTDTLKEHEVDEVVKHVKEKYNEIIDELIYIENYEQDRN